ncbi:hypothetical protein QJQ45_024217 [Haematococcus lacustris]|nr:hypothetical protein QJQ45_024217 [Haematococcus lacustris]
MLARGVFLIGLAIAVEASLLPAGAEVTRGLPGPVLTAAQKKVVDATTAAMKYDWAGLVWVAQVCLDPNTTVRTSVAMSIGQAVAQGLRQSQGSSPSCQPSLAVASQLAKAVADSVETAFVKDAHGCLEAAVNLGASTWPTFLDKEVFNAASAACTANTPPDQADALITTAVARVARGVFLIGLAIAVEASLLPAGAEVTRGAQGGPLPHLGRALQQANQSGACQGQSDRPTPALGPPPLL